MVVQLFLASLALVFAFCVDVQAGCKAVTEARESYTVCEFDPSASRIEVFNLDPLGVPFGNFENLAQVLDRQGKRLIFAMNGGMFGADLKPIGLYVENRKTLKRLNRRSGGGNFHLKPNGVFHGDGKGAAVSETDAYARLGVKPQFATQSGPMLVIDGKIHPKFSASGTSEKIRNGVGVKQDGTVVFAISETPVNFHRFALLFRDVYGCRNALFLDGSVSSLYSVELGRNDGFVPLGPMVGVTEMK
jgi:uncharacterized protein YigE (DUF2233 family)